MKVLIVDDHLIVREGLTTLLKSQPDIKVAGGVGSINEAVSLARQIHPDVVLMDYGLPDGTGVEATNAILADNPNTKIIFLTVHGDDERLFAALRAGAVGYLMKDLSAEELLASIRAIERNEIALTPEMVWRVVGEFSKSSPPHPENPSRLSMLTLRELDILRELAIFSSNAEIARHFSLSEKTVKNHVHTILEKLKLKNRREAAWFAHEHGIGVGNQKSHF
jgi:DNA-binding NarL/FixJ family response regulator